MHRGRDKVSCRGRDKVSCRGRDKSKVKELGGTAPPTLTSTLPLTCRPSQSLPRTRIPSFRCTRWGQLFRTPHLACPEAPGYQLPPPSLPPLLRRCAVVYLYKSLHSCSFIANHPCSHRIPFTTYSDGHFTDSLLIFSFDFCVSFHRTNAKWQQ
jgi:hypothetical protein